MQGCSLQELFLFQEINKITVVRYTSSVKHHRAYFERTALLRVANGKRYLFLYHRKRKDLALILRKKDHYTLYHFFDLSRKPVTLPASKNISARQMLRLFAKKSYRKVDLLKEGFVVTTGLRRYKGVKTLLIDVKDYRALKKRYEEAIRHYNAGKIRSLSLTPPASMLKATLLHHYALAVNGEQKEQLRIIARKLHIALPSSPSDSEEPRAAIPSVTNRDYTYYLHKASMQELKQCLTDPTQTRSLSDGEFLLLRHRLEKMQQEDLLRHGSIEALIKAYKTNKDPRFKQRIFEMMKAKQEEGS